MSIEISRPNADRMFFIESNGPSVAEAAAGPVLCRHAFVQRERRMQSNLFLARIFIAQNICDVCRRLSRCDSHYRLMFRCQKLRAHRRAATSQSGIASREINEARLGISQNKTGAIIVKALWKIEAPLLQLIERWARTELAQYKNGRHIQRATERFAQTHRPKIVMTVILWVVIGVLVANCIGRVRQQAGSGEQ